MRHPLKNPLTVIARHISPDSTAQDIGHVVERVYDAIPPAARMIFLRVCGVTSRDNPGSYDYNAKIGQPRAPDLDALTGNYVNLFGTQSGY